MSDRFDWTFGMVFRIKRRFRRLAGNETASWGNPHRKITVAPVYWGLDETVLEFVLKLLEGYKYEVEHGSVFIADHEELTEVDALIHDIRTLDPYDVQDKAEEILTRLAKLLPYLWD